MQKPDVIVEVCIHRQIYRAVRKMLKSFYRSCFTNTPSAFNNLRPDMNYQHLNESVVAFRSLKSSSKFAPTGRLTQQTGTAKCNVLDSN